MTKNTPKVDVSVYGEFDTAWCPGCGNFSIIQSLKKALAGLGLKPHQVAMCSGIGQAAKTPQYLKANVFNGLHGRGLPSAQGVKLANPELVVINESGDGCNYGEGGNHFLAALRRNINMTLIVHDNQIYGLTKGQASPTTVQDTVTKTQPHGAPSSAFNPIAVAVAMKASFVARSFSGDIDFTAELIQQAVQHDGFALVDVFQPCVSFNKTNTFAWYKQRCKKLPDSYDPSDWNAAMEQAMTFGDEIPIGVIYKNEREPFRRKVPTIKGPLAEHKVDRKAFEELLETFA
jgi:2-oxoglutarate ferredoxin oxidoreductase subunit beta